MDQSILIEKIQRKFAKRSPNGFLLGWDVNRFHQPLTSLFADYKVTNETDFNYSYCNSYDIELRKNETGEIFVLTLKISFIVDAYALHMTRYSSNKRTGKIIDIENNQEYAEAIETAKSFMREQKFIEVRDDEMEQFVEKVELELADRATVGKCLFDDYE